MFIPDPILNPCRIPDPTTATKDEGEKLVVQPFLKIWVWGIQGKKAWIPDPNPQH
jgi:hypothetical protein